MAKCNTANQCAELFHFSAVTDLPLAVYRGALAHAEDSAEQFEHLFGQHGWRGAWRDGIYPYHHFHATTHEVLGIARGTAEVRFGGDGGPLVRISEGDVIVIPAGVSHRKEDASDGLLVVGAYPGGDDPDIQKGVVADHPDLADRVRKVPLPAADPVFGRRGSLLSIWAEARIHRQQSSRGLLAR